MDVVCNMQTLREMTMTSRDSMRLVTICLLALASSLLVQQRSISTGGEQKSEPIMVNSSDIPDKVRILGKLGQPLGQLVTVRGKWTTPFLSKPAELPVFIVNQVNDRPLDKPVEFINVEPVGGREAEFAKKTVGEEWVLRGVETGGFEGFSDQVWAELGQPPMARPPRGFLTRFCYVNAKSVAGPKHFGRGKE